MCYASKSEISPHNNFFSTDIVGGDGEKLRYDDDDDDNDDEVPG